MTTSSPSRSSGAARSGPLSPANAPTDVIPAAVDDEPDRPGPGGGPRHRSTDDPAAHAHPAGAPSAVDAAVAPTRGYALLLVIGGAIGLVAAFVLVLEKISQLSNPNYVPSCSIDPVLSCGSIMRTAQASVLGFPNPIMGVASFPLLVMAGALMLGRVELPRWCWLGLQFGATAGVAFVHWLIIQSLGPIHALCPYCMVVWAVVIPIFWFTTTHNIAAGHLELGGVGDALVRFRYVVLAVWYLAVIAAIVSTFPAYFGSYVGL